MSNDSSANQQHPSTRVQLPPAINRKSCSLPILTTSHLACIMPPAFSIPRFFSRLILVMTIVVSCTAADESTAVQDDQPASGKAVSTAELTRLLQQLDSPRFTERQQATAALLALDVESSTVLQSLHSNLNPAARQRLSPILQRLHRRWFENQLQQLQQAVSEDLAATFPDWHDFRLTTPKSDAAVQIFIELIQAEPELFTCRLFDSERLPVILESRAKDLESHCTGSENEEFPVAQAAALMLVASNQDVQLLRGTSYYISRCFDDQRFSRLLQNGEYSYELQQLCNRWILRPRIAPDRPLLFAMQHRLSAGRDLALRVLAERRRGPRVFYAAMALGVLGDAQDLPFLESLFTDSTLIWPPGGVAEDESADSPLRLEVRDAALLAACHLRGITPEKIGLTSKPAPATLYQLNTVGFVTDEARQRSYQEYQNLLQGRKE